MFQNHAARAADHSTTGDHSEIQDDKTYQAKTYRLQKEVQLFAKSLFCFVDS